MKTHYTLKIFLIFLILTAFDRHKKIEVDYGKKSPLAFYGEILDLSMTTITEQDAEDLLGNNANYVKFETGDDFFSVPNPVNSSYIDKNDWLFLSTKAQEKYVANGSPCGTAYINAVRIIMGVDLAIPAQPKTKLFFQPLYLCRKTDLPGQLDTFQINSNAADVTYEFNGTDFVPLASEPYATNYQTYLRINKYASSGYRGFIYSNDDAGDAKSAIYPIQEFLELIDDNNNAQGVYVLNTGYRTGSIFNRYTRHGLLFCPDNFLFLKKILSDKNFRADYAIEDFVGTFTNLYADKGGLCPPDCDFVFYRRR